MANISTMGQQAAYILPVRLTFNQNCLKFSGKKVRRMEHQQKKDRTERARGLGRERGKRNQMTALWFQTGGKPLDIPGLPLGGWGYNFGHVITGLSIIFHSFHREIPATYIWQQTKPTLMNKCIKTLREIKHNSIRLYVVWRADESCAFLTSF